MYIKLFQTVLKLSSDKGRAWSWNIYFEGQVTSVIHASHVHDLLFLDKFNNYIKKRWSWWSHSIRRKLLFWGNKFWNWSNKFLMVERSCTSCKRTQNNTIVTCSRHPFSLRTLSLLNASKIIKSSLGSTSHSYVNLTNSFTTTIRTLLSFILNQNHNRISTLTKTQKLRKKLINLTLEY